jgi:heat shock protein HslJ
MQLQAHERTPRPGRKRRAWLVGGIVVVLLLAAVLWEGKPWTNLSARLVDTSWRIEKVRGVPMKAGGYFTPFLQFLPHATIFGTDIFLGEDTCNALQGTYVVTGDQLQFTDIGGTLVGCQDGTDVIGALTATHSWHKDGDRLFLYDARGTGTIELTRTSYVRWTPDQPAPTPTQDPNAGPVVDSSRLAIQSPSATNT